jgi:Family of unknown function (DUF6171)
MKHSRINNVDVGAHQQYDETPRSQARLATCMSCEELNSAQFCKQCNCFMPLKVLIPKVNCPLNKWNETK